MEKIKIKISFKMRTGEGPKLEGSVRNCQLFLLQGSTITRS